MRVFIIFHDCGHGSYFKFGTANNLVGLLAGILTFTPYCHWRWEHATHHGSSGALDRRGTGDVWTVWDEKHKELVGYGHLRKLRKQHVPPSRS